MQIVVTSFDVIVGCGAAKTYTALALQTISRHFRCLRDAISGQLLSTRKSLGEEDAVNAKNSSISRLHFVDQELRQQGALQQLGMIQQHAWRPQRGLPESSVTILRAWLFEHFLHPYPKDSDKLMLARQTGLSRSQVSNWFINARVRLWKPMVEEMHKEEIGETELDSISPSEYVANEGHSTHASEELELQGNRNITAGKNYTCHNNSSKSGSVRDREIPRTCEFGNSSHVIDDNSIYGGDRYISFEAACMERFGNDNYAAKMHANAGVSLTLGLQHCDGGGLSVPNERQSFLTMGGEDV